MKYQILTVLLFFSLSNLAQSFNDLITLANQQYQSKDFIESSKSYEQAFTIQKGSSSQYYNAACSFALAGQNNNAVDYLTKAVNAGWTNVSHLKSDSDLTNLHAEPEWSEIIKIAQANLDEYEKDFNKPLKTQLEQIYVRDQMLRQLWRDAETKFGKESDEMKYFWKLMAREDSLNEADVIGIIDQYGWVGKNVVGGKANITLWLVIQHASLLLQEKYVPLLEESVKKGESNGSHLALLHDRILMRNGKPQKYGSQLVSDPDTGKDKLYDLEDPENVNDRRQSVGLGPLEDYLERMGVESK